MADVFVARATVIAQIAISIIVLAAGLFVILSGRFQTDEVAWASGVIGVVVGYWLR